jgi:hypothetical protein
VVADAALQHLRGELDRVDSANADLAAALGDLWRRTGVFQLYLLAEAAFVVLYVIKRRQFQPLSAPAELTPEQRQIALDRALTCTADRRQLVSGWFQGAPFACIFRGNAEEWVAWCLFGKFHEDLSRADSLELSALVDRAERHWELGAFPAGYNEDLRGRCMRLSLDPVGGSPRLLLIYMLVAFAQTSIGLFLKLRHEIGRASCRERVY